MNDAKVIKEARQWARDLGEGTEAGSCFARLANALEEAEKRADGNFESYERIKAHYSESLQALKSLVTWLRELPIQVNLNSVPGYLEAKEILQKAEPPIRTPIEQWSDEQAEARYLEQE